MEHGVDEPGDPPKGDWGQVTVAKALLCIAIALALPLGLGLLARLHPAFDAFAHFRIHLAVLLALVALPLLFTSFWWQGGAVLLLVLAALATVLAPWALFGPTPVSAAGSAGAASGPLYRVLHLNLRYDNPHHDKVLSLIGRTSPDVIVLNEVSVAWQPELERLRAAYPDQLYCQGSSYIGGVAVLSRRPFESAKQLTCHSRGELGIARIDFGGRPVDVASMHLTWPWPFRQPLQIDRLAPDLATLGDTAILAGDFNATGWSAAMERIAEAGGLELVSSPGPTWLDFKLPMTLRPLIGLDLDHMLVKGDVIVHAMRIEEDVGSDHLPLLLEFALRPPPAARREPAKAAAFEPPATPANSEG